MKKVAVLQSNYLPWKGYFDLIHDVDLFVFYDDVQYTKNDWRNRNQIKTAHGLTWITVPTGKHLSRLICEVELRDPHWQEQHWKTISQSYGRCPFFSQYTEFFQNCYLQRSWTSLSELNQYLIRTIATEFLGIRTEFRDSRDFGSSGKASGRLLNLLKKTEAKTYFSGPAARAYLDEAAFAEEGIEVVYKDYGGYPDYPQLHPPFAHNVSIIDLLFNRGPESPSHIWGWRNQ